MGTHNLCVPYALFSISSYWSVVSLCQPVAALSLRWQLLCARNTNAFVAFDLIAVCVPPTQLEVRKSRQLVISNAGRLVACGL